MNKIQDIYRSLERETDTLQKFEDFVVLMLAYTKQDKLNVRDMKYVFIGQPEAVKGYELWKMDYGG